MIMMLRMLYSRAGHYPRAVPLLHAESFSPNTPEGARPHCHGMGRINPSISLNSGIAIWLSSDEASRLVHTLAGRRDVAPNSYPVLSSFEWLDLPGRAVGVMGRGADQIAQRPIPSRFWRRPMASAIQAG